ncbi:MAG: F0F1 ATP synthase subunit B, partial [Gammaproteobacteria bacterium]|nr:F0F1 ATP synthase subunit B [Gammaproteobacteria bacterium]
MTLLGQTIAMIVFVWFCMKFIWPPILAALEERQAKIEEGLAAADQGQEKLVQAEAEAADIVADARKQATGILDQAHARANEIVAEGKADGVKERERQLV